MDLMGTVPQTTLALGVNWGLQKRLPTIGSSHPCHTAVHSSLSIQMILFGNSVDDVEGAVGLIADAKRRCCCVRLNSIPCVTPRITSLSFQVKETGAPQCCVFANPVFP